VGRVARNREQPALAAVQEENRGPARVQEAATAQRQLLVAVLVKVDLHVGGAHARQPPLHAGDAARGHLLEQRARRKLDHVRGFGADRPPEGCLVGAGQALAAERAHPREQPPKERRRERALGERDRGHNSPWAFTLRYSFTAAALKLFARARTTSAPELRSRAAVSRYSSSNRAAAWRR